MRLADRLRQMTPEQRDAEAHKLADRVQAFLAQLPGGPPMIEGKAMQDPRWGTTEE